MKRKGTKVESLENFEFIDGPVPKDFRADYDVALFNTDAHQKTQSINDWCSFHLLRKDKRMVLASIYFCIKHKLATSPLSAPFGSLELSKSITTAQLYDFISFYEKKLRKQGVKKILIKCAPEKYQPKVHNISSVIFFNHHYMVCNAELGACLAVDEQPFMNKVDLWEKRKLKQANRQGLNFKSIPLRNIKEVYQFILQCREERNQSLSLTFAELEETLKGVKAYFISFGVYQGKKLVAASISIKVKKNILYNFYSAHSKSADAFSPVVFLIDGMYTWCNDHHINLIDLGTSAWGGKPNFSLIDFKLRLGATPTMKLTFEKDLS